MRKIFRLFLGIILMFLSVGCNDITSTDFHTSILEKSSTEDFISTGNYDQSPVVLSEDFIEIYVGESLMIEVNSKYSVTCYIYDNDENIVEIKYIEGNKYNVFGLKEGSAEIYFLSLNGKFGNCSVNVLPK